MFNRSRVHFSRRRDGDAYNTVVRLKTGRTAYQYDLGPSSLRRSRQGIPHLSGGAIRYITDRVQGLPGRPRSYQELFAKQIFFSGQAPDLFDDLIRIRQSALALVAAG